MMHEDEQVREDDVIDDVLGDNPRASELRLMRAALEERRTAFRAECERTSADAERTRLNSKLKALDRQIEALRQEEAITEFVETSVKVTLTKAAIDDEE
jgi:hypothetical protein